MSSQDLVQPRADLSSLPEELLKHVVALVDDQDRKISKLDIAFERTGGPYSHESRWPVHYKVGLHALALTSRRMRALALPFLFATVTPKQLAQPFFRLGRLPTVAVDAIVCLDMQSCDELNLLDVAVALPSLKNLREIKVTAAIAALLMSKTDSSYGMLRDNLAIIKSAFGSIASRIHALAIEELTMSLSCMEILECFAAPDSLRKLRVSSTTLSVYNAGLVDVLQDYASIQRLDLDDLRSTSFEGLITESPWSEASLRHIALWAEDCDVIAFVHSIAPSITSIKLRLSESTGRRYDDAGATSKLPALRHFSLSSPPASIHILSTLEAPQLASIDLEVLMPDFDTTFDGAALLEDGILPPALRFLRIGRRFGSHFTDLGPLRDWCARHGTYLVLHDTTPFVHFEVHSYVPGPDAPHEGQKLALQRTLAWATARVEALWRWGIGKGMDELTCALRRVREREVIEEM